MFPSHGHQIILTGGDYHLLLLSKVYAYFLLLLKQMCYLSVLRNENSSHMWIPDLQLFLRNNTYLSFGYLWCKQSIEERNASFCISSKVKENLEKGHKREENALLPPHPYLLSPFAEKVTGFSYRLWFTKCDPLNSSCQIIRDLTRHSESQAPSLLNQHLHV